MAVHESCDSLDAELVDAARGGSKAAFAELILRHRPVVLALARRLLADRGLAADAVQEATVAALVGLDRLQLPARFGAWYAGITLNTARRWLRQPAPGPLPAERADDAPGPEEQAAGSEVAARVRQAVASLPRGQRAAVLPSTGLGSPTPRLPSSWG